MAAALPSDPSVTRHDWVRQAVLLFYHPCVTWHRRRGNEVVGWVLHHS